MNSWRRKVQSLAYWSASTILRLVTLATGWELPGVFVAIWHQDRILLVRNTYRRRYSFPGGVINRGERPLAGGLRELLEEVGIPLQPADLTAVPGDFLAGHAGGHRIHFFRAELSALPSLTLDPVEIYSAEFLTVAEALQRPLSEPVRLYLQRPGS